MPKAWNLPSATPSICRRVVVRSFGTMVAGTGRGRCHPDQAGGAGRKLKVGARIFLVTVPKGCAMTSRPRHRSTTHPFVARIWPRYRRTRGQSRCGNSAGEPGRGSAGYSRGAGHRNQSRSTPIRRAGLRGRPEHRFRRTGQLHRAAPTGTNRTVEVSAGEPYER